ncbi:MAG: putative aminopeptidase [Polaromonas sp.]
MAQRHRPARPRKRNMPTRTNNASLGALSAYPQRVFSFEAWFNQEGRDWPRFYAAAKHIAALPKAERHAAMR